MTAEEKAPNPGPGPVYTALWGLAVASGAYFVTADPLVTTVLATLAVGIQLIITRSIHD